MIKYFCDRCGAEVSEKDVKDDYEDRAANVNISMYTGDDTDEFIQGLMGIRRKSSFILCQECMKGLAKWIVGDADEQQS